MMSALSLPNFGSQGSALARVKPSPQASALPLVQPSAIAPSRFAALPAGWAIPLGWTLATPDLAGQAGVAIRNPNFTTTERTQSDEYQSHQALGPRTSARLVAGDRSGAA
jgi:hypothetical protein